MEWKPTVYCEAAGGRAAAVPLPWNLPAEPWLRSVDLGVDPALAQPLFALQQVREDVAKYTAGLTAGQIWATPLGLTPVGFHLRHLAGSTERLTTYLRGQVLSEAQLAALELEQTAGADGPVLLAAIEEAIKKAEEVIRGLAPAAFPTTRYVGRKRIPTTAIGLAVHIGEHAQRHTGQIISGCKLIRAWKA